MFIGRFGVAILTLALAGSLVAKKIVPAERGDPVRPPPALHHLAGLCRHHHRGTQFPPGSALGPIVEYLMLGGGV